MSRCWALTLPLLRRPQGVYACENNQTQNTELKGWGGYRYAWKMWQSALLARPQWRRRCGRRGVEAQWLGSNVLKDDVSAESTGGTRLYTVYRPGFDEMWWSSLLALPLWSRR